MKKGMMVLSLCVAVIFIAFRAGDKKMEGAVSEKFWTGYWYYYKAAVLNRDDGTSRLYLLYLNDTSAAYKYDGKWNVNASSFHASYPYGNDRLYLNGNNQADGILKGKSTHKKFPAASFIFVKEP